MSTVEEIADLPLPRVVLVTGAVGGSARHEAAQALVRALSGRGTSAALHDLGPDDLAARIRDIGTASAEVDVLVVDGGGLLVPAGPRGQTLADLARALRYKGTSAGVLVVPTPGEGADNDAALHTAVLASLEIPLTAVVA